MFLLPNKKNFVGWMVTSEILDFRDVLEKYLFRKLIRLRGGSQTARFKMSLIKYGVISYLLRNHI